MATKRVAKHWSTTGRGAIPGVDKFDPETLNAANLIDQLLIIKQEDISTSVIMKIFGNFDGKSLAKPYDTFTVPKGAFSYMNGNGKMVSNTAPFTTTIGLWIFNVFMLQGFGFCNVVDGYVNETIDKKKFEKIHQNLIFALMEDKIDRDNYKQFLNYTQFLMPFETVLSPNHTEEVLTCTKQINKKKAELAKKYKDGIDAGDPVIAEKMEQELLDYAKEILKDDPGLDPMLSGAGGDMNNNFKNTYVMKGAIRDVDPNAKKQFNIAMSNWADGISADEYSVIANSLAGGPYSRSKKTELGGYWEKLITAAFSTLQIGPAGSDCGTKDYIEVILSDNNINKFMYSYIITGSGLEELTMDTREKYLNKKVKMRFSTCCKSKDGICHHCAGNFFYRRSQHNSSVGVSMAQIASNIKLSSMKQFHNSTIKTISVNPSTMFGVRHLEA